MELKNTIFRRTLPFKEVQFQVVKRLLRIAMNEINQNLTEQNEPTDHWLNSAMCGSLTRLEILPMDAWDNDLNKKINPKLAHQIHLLAVQACNNCPVVRQCYLETKVAESTIRAGKQRGPRRSRR